jgi:8-oxo-dGTP pyrophosphatase MutT (NUDIX family)
MNRDKAEFYLKAIKNKTLPAEKYTNIIPDASGGLIRAAVLLPLALKQGELSLLFTRRSDAVNSHRGQVSFPGGQLEPGDRDLRDTALRETCEEIGIQPDDIDVMGTLKPLKSATGFHIYPYVGFIRDLNGLHKNDLEVEKVFCIPLDWLTNEDNLKQEDYVPPDGSLHKVWVFKTYAGERVWGITAQITKQLIDLLR